jgi:isopentenyl phosphate kinase
MYILKLGGSVITDKTKEKTFKQKIMNSLSESIKKSKQQMIIVHGAGSFGHILAKKYELNEGYKSDGQIKGFSETHEMVQYLNSLVLKSLQKYDIPAVSISPHSIVKLDNRKLSKMDFKIFADYLGKKFIPVTFGDVVLDKKLGFSICSGDLLVEILADYFKPEKIIFAIDEDGLYTSNPKIDKKAKLIKKTSKKELEELSTKLDKHADVTGGMGGKIETIKKISKLGIDTVLLNGNKPDRLYKVLVGEETKSTVVIGD